MAVLLQFIGLILGLGVIVLCSWLWPTFGTALGLSISFCWSLAHVAYAVSWFRRQRRRESGPGDGEGEVPSVTRRDSTAVGGGS